MLVLLFKHIQGSQEDERLSGTVSRSHCQLKDVLAEGKTSSKVRFQDATSAPRFGIQRTAGMFENEINPNTHFPPGDSYPLVLYKSLISLLCQTILLQRLQMKAREGGRLMQCMFSLSAGMFGFLPRSDC